MHPFALLHGIGQSDDNNMSTGIVLSLARIQSAV